MRCFFPKNPPTPGKLGDQAALSRPEHSSTPAL